MPTLRAEFAFVCLVCGSVLLFSDAEPKIAVFQTINGSEVIVSSLVVTINGTSFSLICKMLPTEVAIKSGKHFDNRVVWSKKRRKSRFSYLDDLLLMANSIPDASLSFTNVTLKDQGVYFCTSIKYKLLKVLNLIVKPEVGSTTLAKNPSNIHTRDSIHRTARDIVLVPSSHYNYTGDFKPFTYPDPAISPFTMRNDHSNWLYGGKNDAKTEFTSGNNLPSWFYKDKDHDNSESLSAHSSLVKFLYLMTGGVLLFVIIFVAVRCCHEGNNDTPPDMRSHQPRNRAVTNRNMCSHLVCIQNRSTHPFAECLINTNDARRHPVRDSNSESLRINHLDLPPTYDDSTATLARNSKYNLGEPNIGVATTVLSECDRYALPPSYEEALSNEASLRGAGGS